LTAARARSAKLLNPDRLMRRWLKSWVRESTMVVVRKGCASLRYARKRRDQTDARFVPTQCLCIRAVRFGADAICDLTSGHED
jgi:hypothetical protein